MSYFLFFHIKLLNFFDHSTKLQILDTRWASCTWRCSFSRHKSSFCLLRHDKSQTHLSFLHDKWAVLSQMINDLSELLKILVKTSQLWSIPFGKWVGFRRSWLGKVGNSEANTSSSCGLQLSPSGALRFDLILFSMSSRSYNLFSKSTFVVVLVSLFWFTSQFTVKFSQSHSKGFGVAFSKHDSPL